MKPYRFAPIVLALALLTGCASTQIKQKVSAGHQTVRAAIVSVDDLERRLCEPAPTQPNHCTATGAAAVGLTDAKHQEISRALAKAYDSDVKVSAAIIAWRSGDPMPKDLPTLLADANDTLLAIQPIAGQSSLYAKATDLLKRVAALAGLFAQE
jgi:hypothetical protein